MPISSKIGIFSKYASKELERFIEQHYGIHCNHFRLNKTAMDNTVIEADGKWIIKIYETKVLKEIKKAYRQYLNFAPFYAIQPMPSNGKSFYTIFHNHVLIFYPKANGIFNRYSIRSVQLIARFHAAGIKNVKMISVQSLINKIKRDVQAYLSEKVIKKLKDNERYTIYQKLLSGLSDIPYPLKCEFSIGKIHGDASPSNIIHTPWGTFYIDIDAISTGYQIFDLIDFFLKKTETYSSISEKRLLKHYFEIIHFPINLKKFYQTLNILACYQGVKIALSTEYYCFEKHKFSEWDLNAYYLVNIKQLLKNIEQRISYLKRIKYDQ